jgi:Mg2+ and Co2+ transporter CorA
MWGMNIELPVLPGGPHAQFWGVVLLMLAISGVMLWAFKRRGWL